MVLPKGLITGRFVKLPSDYKAQSDRPTARGRHKPGVMNKTEAAYADQLETMRQCGEILAWAYEPLKFRLADSTFYTPDFFVLYADLSIEMHEVKGHWEDDARVKIKVAAELHWWFRFVAVKPLPKKRGGGWDREVIGKHGEGGSDAH